MSDDQLNLAEEEIRRVLFWAAGCDGESYIDERDWPLIARLSAAIDVNPASVVPNHSLDVGLDPYTPPLFKWGG